MTRLAGSHLDAVALPVRRVVTFVLVVVGWVFFRAPDLATAMRLLRPMLTPSSGEPLQDGLALLICWWWPASSPTLPRTPSSCATSRARRRRWR